ncbi:TPR repeat protein, SEL1 subfamily [Thermoplasmatales archaeon BRNA1]|nr:TPR repeat protein, SEL1 subfamily [Thermoplasmatales archaeon BRNA1]
MAGPADDSKGFILDTDDGEIEVGIREIEELAASEDPAGMYALGYAYLFGVCKDIDKGRGYDLLEKAAEKGNPEAKVLLVRMTFEGDYFGLDTEKCVQYSKDAADEGIAEGQLYYGVALMDGEGVEADPAAAAEMFRKAAMQGNQEARNSLAYMYLEGNGVEQDTGKAFTMFRTAAKAGNVNSQYQMGVCYETGTGCEKSYAEALRWYRKAADQGDAYAEDRIGIMYYNGDSTLKADPKKSFEWFLRAASNGIVDSMYSVGCYYADGFGCEKDISEARKWLNMAKDNGHEEAGTLLDRLADL